MRKAGIIRAVAAAVTALLLSGCTGTDNNITSAVSVTDVQETAAVAKETDSVSKTAAVTKETESVSKTAPMAEESDRADKTAAVDEESDSAGRTKAETPYTVKALLREYTAADDENGIVAYGRYTELIAEDGAPETLKKEAEQCNKRALESVKERADALVSGAEASAGQKKKKDGDGLQYADFAYIVTVMRADDTAFSFLETELETGLSSKRGVLNASEYSSRFFGHTFETKTGREIQLSELFGDEKQLETDLEDALYLKYKIRDLAETDETARAWTSDALGIRFFFNSEAVSDEKRREEGDYSSSAVTTAIPYSSLETEKGAVLAEVPKEYIAQMESETSYDLPYGGMSVMLTEKDGDVVFRITPHSGKEEELIIEYGDQSSAYFIIRSQDGFYLFRENIGYQEGFFYDFSRKDGGYGRFAYNTAQYIDSYLREIDLASAYSPRCVHMCEKRRSFGKSSYDESSFIPNGYYSFPDDPEGRYKLFELTDDGLSIDSYNTACRVLEDFTAVKLDKKGNEAGEITVKAGSALILEKVRGQGRLYLTPPERSNYNREYIYDCSLADGTKVRFVSKSESVIYTNGAYMTRFTKPVSLWEAQFDAEPEEKEVFTVNIGGKEYPVIPDYSLVDHNGEEIDFGDEIWWQTEGYVGKYVITEDDMEEMKDDSFAQDAVSRKEGTATLEIAEDGHAVLDYFGLVYEGDLPEKRYYHTDFDVLMHSKQDDRAFIIRLREGEYHSAPGKIEMYSEGLPATNEPSMVPPLALYLTKE